MAGGPLIAALLQRVACKDSLGTLVSTRANRNSHRRSMLHRAFLACLLAVIPTSLLAQSVTRYEQDDPRITYTGVWYPNTNSQESGGSAMLANLKGSQVIVIFNGTGITWIGPSDYYTGMCYLTLDGVQRTVDTSNPAGAAATLYQQPLYSVSGQ